MTATEAGEPETAAQLAVIGGAFSFALAGVFGRRFQRLGVNPLVTATGQLIASTIVIFLVAFFFAQPWVTAISSIGSVSALVALALLSTAVAYIVYFGLLASSGAVNLLLVTLLLPVTAVILGVAFLNETLLQKHLVGMGLLALGLGVMDGRPIQYFLKFLVSTTKHSGSY